MFSFHSLESASLLLGRVSRPIRLRIRFPGQTSLSCQLLLFRQCSLITQQQNNTLLDFLRKEVIQPHLPIRLPCYDFTPVISPAFGSSLLKGWVTDFGRYQLPWCDGRCVQDPGTYSPRHSDSRLLAIPASCSRVADCSPN